MAYKLNPFTKKLDFYGVVPTGSSDPSSASPGDLFINTSDNGMKVYYGGNWQTLHTNSVSLQESMQNGMQQQIPVKKTNTKHQIQVT